VINALGMKTVRISAFEVGNLLNTLIHSCHKFSSLTPKNAPKGENVAFVAFSVELACRFCQRRHTLLSEIIKGLPQCPSGGSKGCWQPW